MKIRIINTPHTIEHNFTLKQHQQATANHSQTLMRLNARGGVSWAELTAILECVPYNRLNPKYTEDMFRQHCEKKFGVRTI